MLWQEILNTVGLVSNIVGVIYAFKYGFPQSSQEASVSQTAAQFGADPRKRLARSQFGLMLMAFGFACSLVATWIPYL